MASSTVRRVFRAVVPPSLRPRAYELYVRVRGGGDAVKMKRTVELDFWHKTNDQGGGQLWNKHYQHVFMDAFGLDEEFYRGKRLLDIGCGPAGSLEWATMAEERVGLDPLVDEYRSLGIDNHQMRYVASGSEHIPFADNYFDVVSTFNSLDHVDDVHATIAEIVRVLKPGGTILLMVDVNHEPTPTEPLSLPWDVTSWFGSSTRIIYEGRFENDESMYVEVLADHRWDPSKGENRVGALAARLEKI